MLYFNNFIIDSSKLISNVEYIRSKIGNKMLCAVVKADAYGHKASIVCDILKDKVDYFAVSCMMEAKSIRNLFSDVKILVLGKTQKKDYFFASKNNIDIAVSNLSELEDITSTLRHCSISIHIAVNTGMNRYGVREKCELDKMLEYISLHQNVIHLVGIFSHFATKESDREFIDTQYNRFKELTSTIPEGIIKHITSTYVTLSDSDKVLDMTRCGYSLYDGLYNCLNITSKVVEIMSVKKGESVGYDRTFIAPYDTKIGIIPIGYADGLDRRLSNNFKVFINGKYYDLVGNICMDCCMIWIDGNVNLYDEVEILGDHITYDDYAKALDISKYDAMLKFRYKRMNIIVK